MKALILLALLAEALLGAMAALLLWVCCAFRPVHAQGWAAQDTALQIAVTASLAADWAQTKDIKHYDQCWEENKILGRHPTDKAIDHYFLAVAVGHAAIAYSLPSGWPRTTWQGAAIAIEVAQVIKNKKAGFRFSF